MLYSPADWESINKVLPAMEKKMQHIKNTIGEKYHGTTYALYYQSATEILEILKWIDNSPKNVIVWEKWQNTVLKPYFSV